jgi:hypothetical protein
MRQGWHGYYAATQLKNVGVVSETCLPYQPQDNVCTSKCSGATTTKIKAFYEGTKTGDWGSEVSTPTWIKNHLQNGPVQASITDDYAVICPSFGDQTSCETLNDCFWNGSSCVPFDCAYYADQTSCDADTDCAWNAFVPVCEFAACSSYIDQTDCDSSVLCDWDSGTTTCMDHIFLDCVSYTDQTSCETYAACSWDTGLGDCADSCTGFSTEIACEADANCIWDAFFSACMAY